jgi:hypothetical protein
MATMKHAFIIACLFFFPALTRADSFVSVVIVSDNLGIQLPGEDTSASFVWDTTTNILSDFNLSMPSTAPVHLFALPSGTTVQLTGTEIFNLGLAVGPDGAFWALSESDVADTNGIFSTPGTRGALETLFQCANCDGPQRTGSLFIFNQATSTVTSLGNSDRDGDDPVATPEPNTLVLLGAGITALALTITLQKFQA